MFRCEWCESYRDKSECCENPLDDCSNICQECESEHLENEGQAERVEREIRESPASKQIAFAKFWAEELARLESEEDDEERGHYES